MNRESKLNIMIVDDSDLERENLKRILEPVYNIIIAKSGEAALKKAKTDKPDIILLDIVMPKLNGFEVLSRFKESSDTRDIPILCITGLNNAEDEEKGLFLGAVDYIIKPYNSAIVKARVRTHAQIVQHIRTIEQLGMIDALTGLPNMRHFDYKIHIELARAARKNNSLSLISIDIDGFKSFNEQYGHPKGDELLQEMADAIRGVLKKPGYFTAHLGADEFSVLMPNTHTHAALIVADDIRAAASNIEMLDEKNMPIANITVSIGIASMLPVAESKASELITKADKALYRAKSLGGNRAAD